MSEFQSHAWVRVHNGGSANAGACSLRVWHFTGAFWAIDATVAVPAIPVGASVWVFVPSPAIAAPVNAYRVDVFNVVPELLESNNSFQTP